MFRPPPTSTLFPYTTLFRSDVDHAATRRIEQDRAWLHLCEPSRIDEIARLRIQRHVQAHRIGARKQRVEIDALDVRSEEHTSELQSRQYLVCRLLLEKKKKE